MRVVRVYRVEVGTAATCWIATTERHFLIRTAEAWAQAWAEDNVEV